MSLWLPSIQVLRHLRGATYRDPLPRFIFINQHLIRRPLVRVGTKDVGGGGDTVDQVRATRAWWWWCRGVSENEGWKAPGGWGGDVQFGTPFRKRFGD